MAKTQGGATDWVIRGTTTLSVTVLAVIAAIVSYKHMYLLVRRYGETSWTAALLPVSVDGMIVVSSMSLLLDSRHGRRSGLLPWSLLIIGSAASLAANVAVAEPSVVGRLIAGWPSCALIGSYELLMRQIRHTMRKITPGSTVPVGMTSEAAHTAAEEPHRSSGAAMVPSYAPLISRSVSSNGSEKSRTDGAVGRIRFSDRPRHGGADHHQVRRSLPPRAGRGGSAARQQAWQWAVANRTPAGELPPGKAIAREFGRSERWGRLVKQAGLAGEFERGTAAQV